MISGIIKKANLSADKQAVREMNMALAEEEAHDGYVKPADVETAMQILANHGYNSKNWQCLTAGYEVYWDKQENRMVLYNSATAEVEYPEEYIGTGEINVNATNGRWQAYNGNFEAAFTWDFSFKSTDDSGKVTGYALNSVEEGNTSAATLSAVLSGSTANTIKSAIGVSAGTVYVNAASTQISAYAANSSYAKIDSYYVSNSQEIVLDNTGVLKANTYVVSLVEGKDGLISNEAKKAAGEFVYSLFVQMNTGSASTDATIIFPEGSTIDVSSHEWKAADTFTGYFGVADTDNDGNVEPIVIDGARLTDATGHALTYKMAGDNSKYCCTGFFGAVYGNATIENVTFKNLNIQSPGADFVIAKDQNNRNCVGVIGAIIPDPANRDAAVNVTIRNVKVEDTTINGIGSVGGLIGYIGAEQGYDYMCGNVTIENCDVDVAVSSSDSVYVSSSGGYSPIGALIGFTCRCGFADKKVNINVKDTVVKGTSTGYGKNGAIIGDLMNEHVNLNLYNVDATGVTLVKAGTCTNTADNNKNFGKDFCVTCAVAAVCTGKVYYDSDCKFNSAYDNVPSAQIANFIAKEN